VSAQAGPDAGRPWRTHQRPTEAEFGELLGTGEVIEEHEREEGLLHELVLLVEWVRPLHVVFVVDERRSEERIVTVYEPDLNQWSPDYRRRRS
jgi:hypothetical protein